MMLLRLRTECIAVRAVNQSLALMPGGGAASEAVPDWDYLLKIDADSYLPPRYVEQLVLRFEEAPSSELRAASPPAKSSGKTPPLTEPRSIDDNAGTASTI